MGYSERLLEQAEHLVARDARGRPRQDHLRRAISAAYYALFHFLIDEATRQLVGGSPERRELRRTLGRAFDHGNMRRTATSFASGTLPARLQPGLAGAAVPLNLRSIAATF